jgi:hypothetical protein
VTFRPLARIALALSSAILPWIFPAPASAVAPVLWTLETFEDFERGKPEGAAVAAGGDLMLAPALKPLKVPAIEEAAEPFLWSQTVDSKGTLYVGGGSGGKIYRIPRGAQGALYYETGELAVHALAIGPSDVLYAATSPQGKIYRITGEAKGEVYYQPEDRYTWALVVGRKGEVYAGTGERGIIYRIPSKGKAETFFDSEEFHVVSLALDAQGNLLAGTDGKGLLYRITPEGKATVLYDSRLREICAIAIDPKGVVYAAAIGTEGEPPAPPLLQALPQAAVPEKGQAQTGAPVPPPMPIPGIESGATATVTVTATPSSQAVPAQPPVPRSEVYRIDPEGTVSTIWSSQTEVVYSLLLEASGTPIIGSGEPGRVRSLVGAQQSTLLARLSESQVTSLAMGPDRQVFAASSNVGRVYVLDGATSESGIYLSPPCDSQTVSRWGRISWRATIPSGARVELASRSGNSSLPDGTWSDWSAPYASAEGSLVSSPPARFLQWRARLSRPSGGASPSLHAVSVAYLQANLPPILSRATVYPPGVINERMPYAAEPNPQDLAFTGIRVGSEPATAGGQIAQIPEKKIYVKGMRALDWEAEDPNGDALAYDLSFRGEGESAWKPLGRALRETYFAFDSTQLPDGLYRLRVEATDSPSNPAGSARTASLVTDPFVIDNTPPSVQVAARKAGKEAGFIIEASATDTLGPIARAEYSLDAARWVPIAPADGVSDSRAESYSVSLGALRPGEHTVIVKVTDLLGNAGAGKATFNSD